MESLVHYLDTLSKDLGPTVIDTVKSVIDEEANKCFNQIKASTPRSDREDHAHLVDSIKISAVESFGKYGWKLEYEGYNEKGVPYSLIARSLNKGSAFGGVATHHIDTAIRLLKGMDDRIVAKVNEEIAKLK